MIKYSYGDIFSSDCEALVNTVNTVGVMGAGIALECRKRWPEMYLEYRRICLRGCFMPGEVQAFIVSGGPPHRILNFSTKQHWRNPSELRWIRSGLQDLKRKVKYLNIRSVAVPALGCSHGGLNWKDVRAMIEEELSSSTTLFEVYPPKENS